LISVASYPHLSREQDKQRLFRHLTSQAKGNLVNDKPPLSMEEAAKQMAKQVYGR
jgi:hypothetical protein